MSTFRPLIDRGGAGAETFRPFGFARRADGQGAGFAPLRDLAQRQQARRSVPAAPVPTAPPLVEVAPPAPPRISDAEIQRIRSEAFQAGKAAALEEQRVAWKNQVDRVATLSREVEQIRDAVFARSIQDTAEAVVLIAWQILRRELAVPGHQVEALVRSVMSDLRSGDDIFVRVSAEDESRLRDVLPALADELGSETKLRIEAHPSISPGGVIVETTWGRVDATVETQMQAFADTVEAWATATIENHGTEG